MRWARVSVKHHVRLGLEAESCLFGMGQEVDGPHGYGPARQRMEWNGKGEGPGGWRKGKGEGGWVFFWGKFLFMPFCLSPPGRGPQVFL